MKNLILLILFSVALMSSTCESSSSGSGGSGSGGINNNINCPAPGNETQNNAEAKIIYSWGTNDITYLEQNIRISKLAPSSFWSLRFIAGTSSLGNLAIQTDASGDGDKAKVIFSLWGADACESEINSATCSGIGIISGKQIKVPYDFYEGNQYKLIVYYSSSDMNGDWWTAKVHNLNSNTHITLGRLRIPNGNRITSTENIVEYNGGAFVNIDCVPESISKFYPPKANYGSYVGSFSNYEIGNGSNGSVSSSGNTKVVVLGGQ